MQSGPNTTAVTQIRRSAPYQRNAHYGQRATARPVAATPAWRRAGRHPSAVRTAAYLLVLLTAGAYIPSPLYAEYQSVFGFSDLMLTVIYAAFAIASGPALLIFGSTYDSYGPRPLLRISIVMSAVGSACFLFATSPMWLIAGRVAQGVALGAVTGAATALIVRRSRRGARASLIASLAFVAGTAIGPAMTGGLASMLPGGLATPYVIHLAFLVYAWSRVKQLPNRRYPVGRWRPTCPSVPQNIRGIVGTAAATGFLAWTTVGIFLALGPSLWHHLVHDNPALGNDSPDAASASEPMAALHDVASGAPLASALVVVLVLAFSIGAQVVAARMRAQAGQLIGACTVVVALPLLAASASAGSIQTFVLASAIAGVGHGFAFHGAAATVDAFAPDNQRGGVNATLYVAFYLGAGIPTIIVGAISQAAPLVEAVSWLAWAGAAIGVLIAAFISMHMYRVAAEEPASSKVPISNQARVDRAHAHPRRHRRRSTIRQPSSSRR